MLLYTHPFQVQFGQFLVEKYHFCQNIKNINSRRDIALKMPLYLSSNHPRIKVHQSVFLHLHGSKVSPKISLKKITLEKISFLSKHPLFTLFKSAPFFERNVLATHVQLESQVGKLKMFEIFMLTSNIKLENLLHDT